jgi:hypothetical protein
MRPFQTLAPFVSRVIRRLDREQAQGLSPAAEHKLAAPTGTFVHKSNADWLRGQLAGVVPIEIFVWRSISTKFTRTYIHARLAGRLILRFIYWLEERFPRFLGENGQYPIIAIRKA